MLALVVLIETSSPTMCVLMYVCMCLCMCASVCVCMCVFSYVWSLCVCSLHGHILTHVNSPLGGLAICSYIL